MQAALGPGWERPQDPADGTPGCPHLGAHFRPQSAGRRSPENRRVPPARAATSGGLGARPPPASVALPGSDPSAAAAAAPFHLPGFPPHFVAAAKPRPESAFMSPRPGGARFRHSGPEPAPMCCSARWGQHRLHPMGLCPSGHLQASPHAPRPPCIGDVCPEVGVA